MKKSRSPNPNDKGRQRLFLVIVLLAIVGIVWWQYWGLGKTIENLPSVSR
jgi:hypothetical protein